MAPYLAIFLRCGKHIPEYTPVGPRSLIRSVLEGDGQGLVRAVPLRTWNPGGNSYDVDGGLLGN